MKIDSFYAECAALLGTVHECEAFPHLYRTRWNNRRPGRGRFDGHGIIRVFGSTVHVALTSPRLSGIFDSPDEALDYLRRELGKQLTP